MKHLSNNDSDSIGSSAHANKQIYIELDIRTNSETLNITYII